MKISVELTELSPDLAQARYLARKNAISRQKRAINGAKNYPMDCQKTKNHYKIKLGVEAHAKFADDRIAHTRMDVCFLQCADFFSAVNTTFAAPKGN